MTVTSFTDTSKSYETNERFCSCPDFIYRRAENGQQCKHQQALLTCKAVVFQALRERYDVRLNGQEESRRCYYELSLSA